MLLLIIITFDLVITIVNDSMQLLTAAGLFLNQTQNLLCILEPRKRSRLQSFIPCCNLGRLEAVYVKLKNYRNTIYNLSNNLLLYCYNNS